jgi:hypothetical protein
MRFSTYGEQVPRYLHDKTRHPHHEILELLQASEPRLRTFHAVLSTIWDPKGLLDECCWVSTAGRSIYLYNTQFSIAQNLDTFQQTLSVARDFTLCAVNVSGGNNLETLLPWHAFFASPVAKNLRGLLEVILEDRWEGSDTYFSRIRAQFKNRIPPQLAWKSKLPSAVASKSSVPYKEPTLHGIDITLQWPREPSRDEMFYGLSDWRAYVSEAHNQRPDLYSLQIVDVTSDGSTECRIMLITTSSRAMKRLKRRYDEKNRDHTMAASDDNEKQIYVVLLFAIEHIILELTNYVRRSVKLVHELVSRLKCASACYTWMTMCVQDIRSRRKPSVSKVQILMHIRECHQWAAQACRQNATLIQKLCSSEFPCTQDVHKRRLLAAMWVKDLLYLADELDLYARQVGELKSAVIGLIELFDKRRTRNIGFLIAVYVPMAFATVSMPSLRQHEGILTVIVIFWDEH